jgi:hypothetical protein
MIVKNFVMINFILGIDTMYGDLLPEQVGELVDEINGNGGLTMPKDGHSTKKILIRMYRHSNNLK